MTIFSFWIYDRHCNCIYSREYTTTATSPSTASASVPLPLPATQPSSPKKLATASSSTTAVDSNSTSTLTSASASTATLTNGTNGVGTASTAQVHKLTPSDSMLSKGLINVNNNNNASKLLFGTIFSLRKISNSLSSTPNNNNNNNDGTSFEGTSLNKGNLLKSFQTLNYKCHFYETLTGLKLMLLTDPQCRDLQGELSQIYQVFYLNDVVRNQLMCVDFKDGEVISSEVFTRDVDSYWTSLPEFAS
ncbi:unnamed protein product [Ambrosiozyma monospora]|uniref:Trafficking protein particle complex subunit n=1 Tax=Ambrosiozyma monospora TaxID=43982 RepID=A0A9W7DI03_AMBMO|nr:unnamed protein product [Ambrosiozyma monospora]